MRGKGLPFRCPLRKQLYQLRRMIMELEPELKEKFGSEAVLDIQPLNTKSREYREVGLRWFVLLPWPQISGGNFNEMTQHVIKRIQSFDEVIGKQSFGIFMPVTGGVFAIAVGLREHSYHLRLVRPL